MRNVRYPEDSDNPILVPETPEFEDEEMRVQKRLSPYISTKSTARQPISEIKDYKMYQRIQRIPEIQNLFYLPSSTAQVYQRYHFRAAASY